MLAFVLFRMAGIITVVTTMITITTTKKPCYLEDIPDISHASVYVYMYIRIYIYVYTYIHAP